jgi:dolichol kinase
MLIEFFRGLAILIGYFAIDVVGMLALRKYVPMPTEVFRKLLHLILLCTVFIWLYAFETWWLSALAANAFAAMVYPILMAVERLPIFSGVFAKLFVERNAGEFRRSLMVVSLMFAILICVCWGLLGERYLVLAAVMGWGIGDGAAALVGKRFGKRFLMGRMIEGRKSVEGSAAMFTCAFVSVAAVLLGYQAAPWYACLTIALVTAVVLAVVELYTRRGMDTITCPLAAVATMMPLIYLWNGVL